MRSRRIFRIIIADKYYRDSSQTELALQDFQQAVKLAAKPEIYNSIGKLYFDKGNADEAIKNYDLGISKDSTNPKTISTAVQHTG